jgi:hypothetical protein
MIPITRAERQWFLRTMARGFVDYLGTVEPPVPIEDLLTHPPEVYSSDFGVVEMFSNLGRNLRSSTQPARKHLCAGRLGTQRKALCPGSRDSERYDHQ